MIDAFIRGLTSERLWETLGQGVVFFGLVVVLMSSMLLLIKFFVKVFGDR